MNIIGKTVFCLVIALFFVYNARAEQNLALFALDDEATPWVDLALAELSNEPGIALLERMEMGKLQREMALADIGEDSFAPMPGLMQNVGLFAVAKKRFVQVFDGTTGVRLLDMPIASPAALTEAVRLAVRKQSGFKQNALKKISCLPMTAANLSAEQHKLAENIEELLLRKLANMPDVVLLERRHLILILNEPNAERDKLTSQLFAGSLVLKPSISPSDDGMRLRLEFYTPDGKVLLKRQVRTIKNNQNLPSFVDKMLKNLALPVLDKENKSGEAQNFIREAWFAVHQGIDDDALAAAASAGALDAEYEKELCRISAVSAQRLLKRSYPISKAKLRVGLVNLKTSLDAAIRQRIFPVELQQAFRTLFTYSTRDFNNIFAEQHEEARTLTSRGVAAYMKFLQPPPEEKPTMSINERISLLERQSEYWFKLAYFVQVEWDVSYWEQFSLPVLQDFISRSNRLFMDSRVQNMAKLDSSTIRRNLGPNGVTFRTISTGLIRFYPQEHSKEVQRVFERTFKVMASSCVLQYALVGRDGLLKLELGETGIISALNRHQNIDAQLDAFFTDLLRYMEKCLLCNRVGTLPSLVQSCIFGDTKHMEQKIQLQEIAMRRFGCPNVLGEDLLYGYENWSPETAKMVYGKLQEWQTWPMQEYQRQNYARHQELLERRFKLKKDNKNGAQPLIADLVFKNVKTPFKNQPHYGDLTFLGFEQEQIILLSNEISDDDEAKILILELNPKSGKIKTRQAYKGRFGENCGQGLFGAVTDTDYIAVAGYMMHLFPRNPSQNPRVVNMSQYCKEECHSMVVAGKRVFFSFDGQFDNPGNIVEYNLESQKSKCIASTIDRTIVWPMQGYEHPYAVAKLMPDTKNKRLLMLLHDRNKHQYKMQYIVRLWAYYWETGKWEVLSEYLPTFANFQSTSQLLDENGRFWLSSAHGFGPLNTKGEWQPLVVFDNRNRRISLKVSLGAMFEGYDKVPIDYSKTLTPNDAYPVFRDPRGFQLLSSKYAISDDFLFNMETRQFYRLTEKLMNPQLVNGKYLLFNTKKKIYPEDRMLVNLDECL